MAGNLPDDWANFYSTCPACGQRQHASGTETCACVSCVAPLCVESVPPHEIEGAEDEALCQSHKEALTCEGCYEIFPRGLASDELALCASCLRKHKAGILP